jgi:hypothetical protein
MNGIFEVVNSTHLIIPETENILIRRRFSRYNILERSIFPTYSEYSRVEQDHISPVSHFGGIEHLHSLREPHFFISRIYPFAASAQSFIIRLGQSTQVEPPF